MERIKDSKRLVLLLAVILLFKVTFSQVNYLPGYVINIKGDTIHGFIDYRNWGKNPNEINFKENAGYNSVLLRTTNIKEFHIKDEIYVSGIVDVEVSPFQLADLKQDPHTHFRVDTIFLQTLVAGTKSLYYYKNNDAKENFYIKLNNKFELLIYKKYLKWYKDERIIMQNKKYIGQLSIYFNDCPSILPKLEYVNYDQTSLINFFQTYYECSKSDLAFYKKVDKITPKYGILIGATSSTIKFNGKNYNYLQDASFNKSVDFTFGLFLDLIMPRNQGKWSIYNELLYTSNKFKNEVVYYKYANEYSRISSRIEFGYIKFNNMLRFRYTSQAWSLFLNAGLSNGFAISQVNRRHTDSISNSIKIVKEGLAIDDPRIYEAAFMYGFGGKYKHFSIEIRHENGNGMSPFIDMISNTRRNYFIFGYTF